MRGSIVKRAKGSWTIIIPYRDPSTGQRKQRWATVRGTKREADARLGELLRLGELGALTKPTRLTLAEYLRQWLQDYAAIHVRPKTADGYRQKLEGYVIPAIGGIPLVAVQPGHLQALYAQLLQTRGPRSQEGLAPQSVVHVHRILSAALAHSVRLGLAPRNPATSVDPPRPEAKEARALDAAEVRGLLIAAQGTPYYAMIHLAMATGLRRSELLGLRWSDVDMERGAVSVRQGLHVLKGGRLVTHEPKSRKGKRRVALPTSAVLSLRAYRESMEVQWEVLGATPGPQTLLFARADGAFPRPDTLTHAFRKIARRAGLPGVRFHDLRHFQATLLLSQGVHPKVVQERLGHSTIAVTMDTYSHVLPGLQEQAAILFDTSMGDTAPERLAVKVR